MSADLEDLGSAHLILKARELAAKHRAKKLLVPSHAELVDMIEHLSRRLAKHVGYQGPGYNMTGGPDV